MDGFSKEELAASMQHKHEGNEEEALDFVVHFEKEEERKLEEVEEGGEEESESLDHEIETLIGNWNSRLAVSKEASGRY